jgi:hypothetical protein
MSIFAYKENQDDKNGQNIAQTQDSDQDCDLDIQFTPTCDNPRCKNHPMCIGCNS